MTHRAVRVLVAEDEPRIADTLARILIVHGFEAVAVYSGEEAVAVATTFRPDAAILDVVLEGITGIEAAQAILRELPACRIILFSGQPNTAALLAEASAQGQSFHVLPKPVHPQTFLDALKATPPAPQTA